MVLKNIVRFIIFSNIYISLCAAALGVSTIVILDHVNYSVSLPVIVFLFSSTLFIYNFNFLFVKDHIFQSHEKHEWIENHLTLIRFLVIGSAIGVSLATLLFSVPLFFVLLPLGMLSLFYSFPFKTQLFSLKNIPLLKVFLISFVWAAATVAVPAAEAYHSLLSQKVIMLFIERLLFILALAIPFDIRDYELDKNNNIITIPGKIGIARSQALSIFLLICYFLFTAFFEDSAYIIVARLLAVFLACIAIYRIKPSTGEYYYMALIDGMMIIQSALIFIFNLF